MGACKSANCFQENKVGNGQGMIKMQDKFRMYKDVDNLKAVVNANYLKNKIDKQWLT